MTTSCVLSTQPCNSSKIRTIPLSMESSSSPDRKVLSVVQAAHVQLSRILRLNASAGNVSQKETQRKLLHAEKRRRLVGEKDAKMILFMRMTWIPKMTRMTKGHMDMEDMADAAPRQHLNIQTRKTANV